MKKPLALIGLGAILEFYDFAIFIYFAKNIGESLIPIHDSTANLIASFGIFAIGSLVRPLGGIVFSHFGDTLGRKNIFVYTILLMAIPTLLIALIPSYNQIGITATILLIILRSIQGFALGGEIPGSIVFAYELSKHKNKAFNTTIVTAGTNIGTFLAASLGAYLLNTAPLTIDPWRLAFIIGGVFGITSYYLRKNLVETPEFEKYKQFIEKQPDIPFIKLIKEHRSSLLKMITFGMLISASFAVYNFFMPTYLTTYYHFPLQLILEYSSYSLIVFIISALLAGKFHYLFGRSFFIWSIIIFNCINFILFSHYQTLTIYQIAFIHCFILLYVGIICGRMPVLVASFFPTSVRYSGVALTYNICFGIIAGTTQMLLFGIIKASGILWAPALYLMFFSVLALLFLYKSDKQQLINYN